MDATDCFISHHAFQVVAVCLTILINEYVCMYVPSRLNKNLFHGLSPYYYTLYDDVVVIDAAIPTSNFARNRKSRLTFTVLQLASDDKMQSSKITYRLCTL